ncbi:MAG: hypothetical protein QM786_11545 [Breznakibacter sp.]
MPLNLTKKYPELLEIGDLPEGGRISSLRRIFERDIENHPNLIFNEKSIRPIKGEEPSMQLLFRHLTTEEIEVNDENGKKYKRRIFEIHRSMRLHWIKVHLDKSLSDHLEIFSTIERVDGKNANRTYIYNVKYKYVIVLEPQRSGMDYYLLSAYYLNREYGEKMMKKKMKNKLAKLL